MSIQKVAIKFYASSVPDDLVDLIPVFHRWIQDSVLAGMPIDVADYRHVPDGPLVMLIGNEADHGIDATEGDVGFIYSRKRDIAGDNDTDRLLQCLRRLVDAVALLEAENIGFKADTSRLRFVFNDRLGNPNTEAGFNAVSAAVEAAAKQAFGADVMLEKDSEDGRTRLIVHVANTGSTSISDIQANLGGVPA